MTYHLHKAEKNISCRLLVMKGPLPSEATMPVRHDACLSGRKQPRACPERSPGYAGTFPGRAAQAGSLATSSLHGHTYVDQRTLHLVCDL